MPFLASNRRIKLLISTSCTKSQVVKSFHLIQHTSAHISIDADFQRKIRQTMIKARQVARKEKVLRVIVSAVAAMTRTTSLAHRATMALHWRRINRWTRASQWLRNLQRTDAQTKGASQLMTKKNFSKTLLRLLQASWACWLSRNKTRSLICKEGPWISDRRLSRRRTHHHACLTSSS